MDNKIFRVNGRSLEQLIMALNSLLTNEYGEVGKVDGFKLDPNKGIILYDIASYDGVNKFVPEISIDRLAQWLMEEISKQELWETCEFEDWTYDCDQDGVNEKGWLLYTEDWGRVNDESFSIAAIKPAWLWHGK